MRKLMFAAVAGALLIVGAGAARAAYNEVSGTVQAGETVVAGSVQTFAADGFAPGAKVDFTLNSDPIFLGSATANSAGTATLTVTLPANAPAGRHTVTAAGLDPQGRARTVTSPPFVLAAPQQASGLSRTGSRSTVPMAMGGVVLIGAGSGLIGLARRRRASLVAA